MDCIQTIHQLILHLAETTPNEIATIDEHNTFRYAELNQKANQLAHYLQSLHLPHGSFIALAMERSTPLLIAMLAILKTGCAYVPMDAKQPSDRLQSILQDAKPALLLTHSGNAAKFSHYSGSVLQVDDIWDALNAFPTDFHADVNPTDIAYIIYTSGSTGTPKGVMIEHRSVVNYIKWLQRYSDCHQQDRIDFSANVNFDMAVTASIAALALGLQIVICSYAVKKDTFQYLTYLAKNKINIIKITPSFFKVLIEDAKIHQFELPDLQTIILGGEILYTKDCQAWLTLFPSHTLYNEYGPTETTVAVTSFKITANNVSQLAPIVPIGKPAFNTVCKLVRTQPNDAGELLISGLSLARGYLNDTVLTTQQFIHEKTNSHTVRWYKTGDVCRELADGDFEFLKRIDDQIKIRGYKVDPREIEQCMNSFSAIKESAIVAHENATGEKKLIGYYVANQATSSLDHQDIRLFLQQKLPDYMIPTAFVLMDTLPLSESGKLDKHALPKPKFSRPNAAPHNEIEAQLIRIWQQAFQIQDIGCDQAFFELGGHSLIAARIIIEIEKSMQKRIRIEDIYTSLTIAELARLLKSLETNSTPILIEDMTFADIIPLSDFQFIFWLSQLFEPKIKKLNILAKKRLIGKLDAATLTRAMNQVLKNHEILSYKIAKFSPSQYSQTNHSVTIKESNLMSLSQTQAEATTTGALEKLANYHHWNANHPLIRINLFHLADNVSELQIAVPHIIFDEVSMDVLLSELSSAYLLYKSDLRFSSANDHLQFKNYIASEKVRLNQQLETDIVFWEQYLQDTAFVTLPKTEIIRNMRNAQYSTYLPVPNYFLKKIMELSTTHSTSLIELFSAAVAISLKNLADTDNHTIYMNIIRSDRDNALHDKMMGCLLRLDPIKVNLVTAMDLLTLAKSIQQSRLATQGFQACSGMVKMACLNKKRRNNKIKNLAINIAARIYSRLFKHLKLNTTMLTMYGHLHALRKEQIAKNQFLVNINLFNNVVAPNQNDTLFGLTVHQNEPVQLDLTNADNVLEISLTKNKDANGVYLVISGNLNESFKRQIGHKIIENFT